MQMVLLIIFIGKITCAINFFVIKLIGNNTYQINPLFKIIDINQRYIFIKKRQSTQKINVVSKGGGNTTYSC